MTKSSEPIEVTPEIIEGDIVTQDAIQRQLSELAHRATELAAQYEPHEIADRQDHKDSKKARGQVRKDAEAIRKAGEDITARVDAWSAGVRASASRIAQGLDEIGEEYDAHVKAYEDGLLEKRRELLRGRYEEYAPALALPAEGTDAPLVPFGILWQRFAKAEGWGKLTTSDTKAVQSMEAVVAGIAMGERNIDALVAEPDRADVKALYFRTLDMDAAMARAGELADARSKVAALEAERHAQAVEYVPPVTLPASERMPPSCPPAAGAPAPRTVDSQSVMSREQYERTYEAIHGTPLPRPVRAEVPEPSRAATWLFYCRCTAQQAGELESLCQRLGVGRYLSRDGGPHKYKLTPAKD